MDKKQLFASGIALFVVQFLVGCGIFVKFSDMQAYAAPKDSIQQMQAQLNRIEHKLDTVMGY